MAEHQKPARFIILTLALSIILWLFTTTGGRQIFVKEVLGAAFDSQAEHLLRGDPGVDLEDIRHESMIVNGKLRMYFGPFPAFTRMPLNFILPQERGRWSRVCGFAAGLIALWSFAALVRLSLRNSTLPAVWQKLLGGAFIVGFVFGSPLLLLLGNLSIYNEAIIWALAWAILALYLACYSRTATGPRLTWSLVGFSLAAAFALLSRVTFGLPFLLLAPALVLQLTPDRRWPRTCALLLPLGCGLLGYVAMSYARFGNFMGIDFKSYINPVHAGFAIKYGAFDLHRIPYSFTEYFGLRLPRMESEPPFLHADRHLISHPSYFSQAISEVYLSLTLGSAWLVAAAIFGIAFLLRPKVSNNFERMAAGAFLVQSIAILSFFALAQRYAADLLPVLVVCALVFLYRGGTTLFRARYVFLCLVAISALINCLATVSWMIDSDQNVPPETRAAWRAVLGRKER